MPWEPKASKVGDEITVSHLVVLMLVYISIIILKC